MELKFRVTLNTDYHISAGFGIGSRVDSALLRDGDGVPVLRGSTLTGILRDGLWRLLKTAPELRTHYESHSRAEQRWRELKLNEASAYCSEMDKCPLCRIFGSPVFPKRWWISSARPIGAERLLRSRWREGIHETARVRISPRTRRALARHLFAQEEGDAGLAFLFTIGCDGDDEAVHDEAALLFAAARMVRRLGSARRRGRGGCIFHLLGRNGEVDETEETRWLDHFQKVWLNGNIAERVNASVPDWTLPLTGDRKAARYRVIILTEEPVVIAARAEAGNMFYGLGHINGSAFWGALANAAATHWRLRKREDRRDDAFYCNNKAFHTFVELFFRGLVRVSPLYPAQYVSGTGGGVLHAMIPTPLDLLTCKVYPGFLKDEWDTDHHHARGYATENELPLGCPVSGCGKSLESLGGFLPVRLGTQPEDGAKHRDELHPRINPFTQRVAAGDLFGYVALDNGQYCLGELWCQDDTTWQALRSLTGALEENQTFSLRLGRATRRGYGKVKVWLEKIDCTGSDLWRGIPLEDRVKKPDDPITLTLLTDTILPDHWGRFRQMLGDPCWLEDLLNQPYPDQPFKSQIIQAFCKAHYVDNFNNHAGLPRWRDIAIQAGSAVGFRLEPPNQSSDKATWFARLRERFRELEEDGIGLRRQEGFGRLVFNHPVYEGCRDMTSSHIEIPESMALHDAPESGATKGIHMESKELDDWESTFQTSNLATILTDGYILREKKNCDKWSAVARWLHSSVDQPIGHLQKSLLQFGDPSSLTLVARDAKYVLVHKEVEKVIAHLDKAIEAIRQLSMDNEVVSGLLKVKKRVEYLHHVDRALEGIKQAHAVVCDIANSEAAASISDQLDKAEDILQCLSERETTKPFIYLNDMLEEIAARSNRIRQQLGESLVEEKQVAERSNRLKRRLVESLAEHIASLVSKEQPR